MSNADLDLTPPVLLEEMLTQMARPGVSLFLHHSQYSIRGEARWHATLELEGPDVLKLKCTEPTCEAAVRALYDKWYAFTSNDTIFRSKLLVTQIEAKASPMPESLASALNDEIPF